MSKLKDFQKGFTGMNDEELEDMQAKVRARKSGFEKLKNMLLGSSKKDEDKKPKRPDRHRRK